MRPVAMPISAPMPNSPPSANWVEAFRIRIALSNRWKNLAAVAKAHAGLPLPEGAGRAIGQPK